MCTDFKWNNISNMKALVFLTALLFQTQPSCVKSENVWYDKRILGCIPISNRDINVLNEYNQIQIVTDLIHLPLRDIARRPIVPEDKGEYNTFLTCSWKIYEYQTKHGEIVFDAIEMALKDALVREVGSTGPGINLSKVEAKRILNQCKNITGFTPGLKVVRVQNCILHQIQHLAES